MVATLSHWAAPDTGGGGSSTGPAPAIDVTELIAKRPENEGDNTAVLPPRAVDRETFEPSLARGSSVDQLRERLNGA